MSCVCICICMCICIMSARLRGSHLLFPKKEKKRDQRLTYNKKQTALACSFYAFDGARRLISCHEPQRPPPSPPPPPPHQTREHANQLRV